MCVSAYSLYICDCSKKLPVHAIFFKSHAIKVIGYCITNCIYISSNKGGMDKMVLLSYEKFRVLMVKRRMEWKDIRIAIGLAPRTITKLKNDSIVDMEILMRLAEFFKCDISDLVEFKHVDEPKW